MNLRVPALFAIATFASFVSGAAVERFLARTSDEPITCRVLVFSSEMAMGDVLRAEKHLKYEWLPAREVPADAILRFADTEDAVVKRAVKAGAILRREDVIFAC